jgi:hypothetical protein
MKHGRTWVFDYNMPLSLVQVVILDESDTSTFVDRIVLERFHNLLGVFLRPIADVVQHLVDVVYEFIAQNVLGVDTV